MLWRHLAPGGIFGAFVWNKCATNVSFLFVVWSWAAPTMDSNIREIAAQMQNLDRREASLMLHLASVPNLSGSEYVE